MVDKDIFINDFLCEITIETCEIFYRKLLEKLEKNGVLPKELSDVNISYFEDKKTWHSVLSQLSDLMRELYKKNPNKWKNDYVNFLIHLLYDSNFSKNREMIDEIFDTYFTDISSLNKLKNIEELDLKTINLELELLTELMKKYNNIFDYKKVLEIYNLTKKFFNKFSETFFHSIINNGKKIDIQDEKQVELLKKILEIYLSFTDKAIYAYMKNNLYQEALLCVESYLYLLTLYLIINIDYYTNPYDFVLDVNSDEYFFNYLRDRIASKNFSSIKTIFTFPESYSMDIYIKFALGITEMIYNLFSKVKQKDVTNFLILRESKLMPNLEQIFYFLLLLVISSLIIEIQIILRDSIYVLLKKEKKDTYEKRNVKKFLKKLEHLVDVIEEHIKVAPYIWIDPYVKLLNTIAFTYIDFHGILPKSRIKKIRNCFEKIVSIRKKYPNLKIDLDNYDNRDIATLTNYINALFESGNIDLALEFGYSTLELIRALKDRNPGINKSYIAHFFSNFAGILCAIKRNLDDAYLFISEAKDILTKLYKENPSLYFDDYAFIFIQLSNYYSAKGEKNQAILVCKSALEVYEKTSLIQSFLKLNFDNDVVSYDDQEKEIINNYIQARTHIAHIYQDFSETEEAINILKEIEIPIRTIFNKYSLDFFTNYFIYLSLIGGLYLFIDNFEYSEKYLNESIDVYDKFNESIPTSYSLGLIQNYINLGTLYFSKNEYAKAISTLKLAERIINNYYNEIILYDEKLIQHCFYNLGIALIRSGDYITAIKYLSNALKLAEKNINQTDDFESQKSYIQVLNALAFAHELNGDYIISKNYYEILSNLGEIIYKKDPEFWEDNFITDMIKYGYHLARDKEYEKALQIFEKAFKYTSLLYETDNEYWMYTYYSVVKHLADLYEFFNDKINAEKFEKIATQLLNKHPDVDLTREYFPITDFSEEIYRRKLLQSSSSNS